MSPRPAPLIAAVTPQHLLHARPAARPLVADDHHVACLDPLACTSAKADSSSEHAGWTGGGAANSPPPSPRSLRREVALEDREAAGRRERVGHRAHDLLARRFGRARHRAAQRAIDCPRRRHAGVRHREGAAPRAACRRRGTDPPPCSARPASGRRSAACAGRMHEVVDVERDARLAGDRQQVQHGVGRSAGRRHARMAFSSAARVRTRWGEACGNRPDGDLTCLPATAARAWAVAGKFALPIGEIPRNSQASAIVLPVNCPPARPRHRGTRPREVLQPLVRELACRVRPNWPRRRPESSRLARRRDRRDRAAVEDQARHIESGQRHHRAWNRLVAADERHQSVELVSSHDQFDRAGDDLSPDERRAILGAHRDPVRHRAIVPNLSGDCARRRGCPPSRRARGLGGGGCTGSILVQVWATPTSGREKSSSDRPVAREQAERRRGLGRG